MLPIWPKPGSGKNPFFPVKWKTTTHYRVREKDQSLPRPSQEPRMVPPASPRTLGERASSLVLHSARSKLLAEQTTKLLNDTARIFQTPKPPARAARMFPTSQSAAGAPTIPLPVSTKTSGTEHSGVKTEDPKDGQQKSNTGRRKQQFPRRTGGFNFEEKCTICASPRRTVGARVHRGIQCELQTEFSSWQSEFRKALGSSRVQPGGVTLTLLEDTGDKLTKVSREGLEQERKRKSVIRRNIWRELAKQ